MAEVATLPQAVQAYFNTVNRKAFEETADLFAEDGQLVPPFDKPIVGREAIATYLKKEASDMTFTPMACEPAEVDSSMGESFAVKGKVKNSLFVVNVSWQFDVQETGEIASVKVKLLASLKELMNLRS